MLQQHSYLQQTAAAQTLYNNLRAVAYYKYSHATEMHLSFDFSEVAMNQLTLNYYWQWNIITKYLIVQAYVSAVSMPSNLWFILIMSRRLSAFMP